MTNARLMLGLALRELRFRRARTLTIGAVIALAAACVGSIVVLDRNTILTRQYYEIQRFGDADLVLTFPLGSVGEARAGFDAVADDPDVVATMAFLRWSAGDENVIPVHLVVGEADAFRALTPEANSAEGARIFAGPRVRSLGSFQLGDRRLRPEGRVERRYFAAEIGPASHYVMTGWSGIDPTLRVRPVVWVRSDRTEGIRARFRGRAMIQDAPHLGRWKTPEDVAMRAALKVSSLLALVLAAFVLSHTTRLGLLERTRSLGVLRALGVGRRSLVRLGLLEIAIVAVPSALVGLVFGCGVAHGLGRLGVSSLGRFKVWFWFSELPWTELIAVGVASIAIPLTGAWLSLRVVHRIDVAAALGPVFHARPPAARRRRLADVGAGIVAVVIGVAAAWFIAGVESPKVAAILLRIGLLVAFALGLVFLLPAVVGVVAGRLQGPLARLFGPMGRLAARSASRTGLGFLPAIVGVVGVFAVVLTLKNLVGSMLDEIDAWGRRALDGRAWVRLERPVSDATIASAAAAHPDWTVVPILREWLRPFPIRAIDPAPLVASGRIEGEDLAILRRLESGEGAIVSRAFSIQHRVEAGDEVSLPTTDGTRAVPVVAVSDRFGSLGMERAFVLVGRSFAETRLGLAPDEPRPGFVVWGGGLSVEALDGFSHALAAGRDPQVTIGRDRVEKRRAKTRRDFLIFDAVWLFLVGLAAVATAGTILLRALESRRELALLRVVGATRRQFRAYFVSQGVVVGAIGGAVALVIALPMSAAAVWALRRVSGMDVSVAYSIGWATVCWLLALAIGWAAGRLAAARAARLDWSVALKYE